MRLESGFRMTPNLPSIEKITSQFADVTSSPKFLDVVLFVLSKFQIRVKPFYTNVSFLYHLKPSKTGILVGHQVTLS